MKNYNDGKWRKFEKWTYTIEPAFAGLIVYLTACIAVVLALSVPMTLAVVFIPKTTLALLVIIAASCWVKAVFFQNGKSKQ